MLAFIYLAYHMMALLDETVPAFEDTWIEVLGDLFSLAWDCSSYPDFFRHRMRVLLYIGLLAGLESFLPVL
jgi:hypothetical protein